MSRRKRSGLFVVLVSAVLGFTGCKNNNLFGKLGGESSDPQTLVTQAAFALQDRDFTKARELAERVLANDPNNVDALEIAAAAEVGESDLSIGTLVSNILSESAVGAASLGGTDLGSVIANRRLRISSSCGASNSIAAGLDCDRVLSVLDRVICRLQRSIYLRPSNNKMLDLGILCVIRAAMNPIKNDLLDILNIDGDYDVVQKASAVAVCTSNQTVASKAIKDIIWAYQLFNRVATNLGLGSSALVVKIRNDIASVGADVLQTPGQGGVLPQECFDNVFTPLGVNASNFTTQELGVFDAPTSSC